MSGTKWNSAVVSREEQHNQKRQAVLTAGVQLFNSKGFEGTSLDDIAGALNVTKRTIYYYVQSKDEILYESMKRGLTFVEEVVARTNDTDRPVLDRIKQLVAEYIHWVFTDFGASIVLLKDSLLADDRRAELRKSKSMMDLHLRNLLAEGVADGTIRDCDPRVTSSAMFGAINWLPYWNRSAQVVPEEQVIAEFTAFFMSSLDPNHA